MSVTADWSANAFMEKPEPESVDGGTTSAGPLWHSISPRWGHSMHTMCSYHGMFPAKVAHYFIQRYSKKGDTVLDPFSGRGTTALQARMEGRVAVCNDLNPLAYVLSRAKVDPPPWDQAMAFVAELENQFRSRPGPSPMCRMTSECFITTTLSGSSALCVIVCSTRRSLLGRALNR